MAEGLTQGLALAVCGIFVVILCVLPRSTGLSLKSVGIAAAAFLLAASRKAPIPAILAVAGVAGIMS